MRTQPASLCVDCPCPQTSALSRPCSCRTFPTATCCPARGGALQLGSSSSSSSSSSSAIDISVFSSALCAPVSHRCLQASHRSSGRRTPRKACSAQPQQECRAWGRVPASHPGHPRGSCSSLLQLPSRMRCHSRAGQCAALLRMPPSRSSRARSAADGSAAQQPASRGALEQQVQRLEQQILQQLRLQPAERRTPLPPLCTPLLVHRGLHCMASAYLYCVRSCVCALVLPAVWQHDKLWPASCHTPTAGNACALPVPCVYLLAESELCRMKCTSADCPTLATARSTEPASL